MLLEAVQVLQVLLKVLQLFTKGHTPPSFDLFCTSCSSPATGSPAENLHNPIILSILTCSTMLLQSVQTASILPSSLSRPDSRELIMLHLTRVLFYCMWMLMKATTKQSRMTNSINIGPASSPARQGGIDTGDRGRGERSQSRAQVAPAL